MRVVVGSGLLACLMATLLAVTEASAEVRGVISGTITSVDPPLTSAFSVNDTYTAQFVYDETTSDTNGLPEFGEYSAITSFTLSTSGGYVATATSGDITVEDESPDRFEASGDPASGASVGGADIGQFFVGLTDASGAVFTSDALPTVLDLSDFSSSGFVIDFLNPAARGGNPKVQATVDALSFPAVTRAPAMSPAVFVLVAGVFVVAATGVGRRRLA